MTKLQFKFILHMETSYLIMVTVKRFRISVNQAALRIFFFYTIIGILKSIEKSWYQKVCYEVAVVFFDLNLLCCITFHWINVLGNDTTSSPEQVNCKSSKRKLSEGTRSLDSQVRNSLNEKKMTIILHRQKREVGNKRYVAVKHVGHAQFQSNLGIDTRFAEAYNMKQPRHDCNMYM